MRDNPGVHRWVDHTGELQLHVEADSAEDVVAEATRALAGVLGEAEGEPVERRFAVEAADRAGLLAAWLDEIVFVAEHDALLPVAVSDVTLTPDGLSGVVTLRAGRPSQLVKAVTYHRLALEPANGGWSASVVFDV